MTTETGPSFEKTDILRDHIVFSITLLIKYVIVVEAIKSQLDWRTNNRHMLNSAGLIFLIPIPVLHVDSDPEKMSFSVPIPIPLNPENFSKKLKWIGMTSVRVLHT